MGLQKVGLRKSSGGRPGCSLKTDGPLGSSPEFDGFLEKLNKLSKSRGSKGFVKAGEGALPELSANPPLAKPTLSDRSRRGGKRQLRMGGPRV